MSSDDERDYAEEQYNRNLLDDERDPEEETWVQYYDPATGVPVNPPPDLPGGRTVTRQGHRAAALQLISDWASTRLYNGVRELSGLDAALTHAVLALSAPDPEEGTWRQRAIEAEAALTAIGGVVNDASLYNPISEIERILRESGRQTDLLMNKDTDL